MAQYWLNVDENIALSILSANMTPGADVDSSERLPPPRCHPGTRQWLITSIMEWMSNDHRQSDFCWFWGAAGAGKSAVAQTVAEYAAEGGQLGAAFFFSRLQGRDRYTKVWVTIAYQLAVRIPSYRAIVTKQLANESDILNKAPSIQFKRLIADPLALLPPAPGKFLVILDGLDECQPEEAQLNMIELIASVTKLASSSPLIWMVCSRPERHIRAVISDGDFPIRCWKLELSIDTKETTDDVDSYLRSCFVDIREKYLGPVDGLWPAEEDIRSIIAASSGLFAFASTTVRYIDDAQLSDPKGRLEYLLRPLSKQYSHREDHSMARLDRLYARILSAVPARSIRLCHLLGTYILYPSLPIIQMANLFHLNRPTFYHSVQPLLCLVNVPEPDRASRDAIRLYHVSFADYFLRNRRSFLDDDDQENKMTVTRTEVNAFATRFIGLEFIKGCFGVLAQTIPQHAINLAWSPTKTDGTSAFSVSHQLLHYCAANVWSACLRLGDIDDPALYQAIIDFRYPCLRFVKGKIPKSEFLAWIESLENQVRRPFFTCIYVSPPHNVLRYKHIISKISFNPSTWAPLSVFFV